MNESNFYNLAESIKDGILIANAKGQHLYANRSAAEQLRYSIEELLKTELKDLADPESYPMLQQRLRDRIAGRIVPSNYETIIRRKDGTSFPAEITGSKTEWEGQECDLVLFRDITCQKQILNDLKQSKRELFTLMANLPGMAYSCINDHDWTMISFILKISNMFGR
jgi:PAS domain S-box-containing protein